MPADFLTKWIPRAKLESSLHYACNSHPGASAAFCLHPLMQSPAPQPQSPAPAFPPPGTSAALAPMAHTAIATEGDADQITSNDAVDSESFIRPYYWSSRYKKDCWKTPSGMHYLAACDTCNGRYCWACGRTGMYKSPCLCNEDIE